MHTDLDRLTASYELNLVALSIIIAICAAYTFVYLAERVAKTKELVRLSLLLVGSVALGVGIWSMHFVGMLSFQLSVPAYYNHLIVLLSILPAILSSGLALWITSRITLSALNLISAGLWMGLGIAATHYTGMAAMRLPAEPHYDPAVVALSISVAVSLSIVALWLTHHLQNRAVVTPLYKVGAAVLIAVAISAMHYTGMAAVCFSSLSAPVQPVAAADSIWLASMVSAVTFAILGFTLLIASETKVLDRTRELTETLEQLKQSQIQLIQTEKMSGLGQLVAGIAHEVNNPISFIHGNIEYMDSYMQDLTNLVRAYQTHYPNPHPEIQTISDEIDIDFLSTDIHKLTKSMQMGTERIRQLVLSLRNFSRLDESNFKSTDIHEGIDNTLLILNHRLVARPDSPNIEIIKNYDHQIPMVESYPGQINQVFMNLLANAIDALDNVAEQTERDSLQTHPGTIWISTQMKGENWLQIVIADNGLGIPESIATSIFDPFFTTKPVGKGTGLGLSISYQIVTKKHNGKLWVDSTPGEGTQFTIEIPIQQTAQTIEQQDRYYQHSSEENVLSAPSFVVTK